MACAVIKVKDKQIFPNGSKFLRVWTHIYLYVCIMPGTMWAPALNGAVGATVKQIINNNKGRVQW